MFWRRRRKPTAEWIVTVTEIRPLTYDGQGRDELSHPERRLGRQELQTREQADELAHRLRHEADVQAGRTRVKVIFLGH